ncbi:hypothetical protein F5Y10DRAFT_231349 [Nemania abortiva]|nr:hypothetical protein F5Y10DRAFT_231349 [Nemania abortiva]
MVLASFVPLTRCTVCVMMWALCKVVVWLGRPERHGFGRDLYLIVGGTSPSLSLLLLHYLHHSSSTLPLLPICPPW